MKAVAVTSKPDGSPAANQHKTNAHPSASLPLYINPPLQIDGRVIQRKSTCACGGRCPRCESNHPHLQTRSAVSHPGDVYEQEADRIAQQVIDMPEPVPGVAGPTSRPTDGDKRPIQLAANSETAPHFTSHMGAGVPLDTASRRYFESRFGRDFGNVRIHVDAEAAEAVNAHAYTLGRDIVFGAGEYRPETEQGRRLLAHELTHTLQAGTGVVRRSAISDDIQIVWDATPTLDALLARLSRADVQGAQNDADIDTKIATLLATRPGDLWVAQRIRQGQLGTTAGARPIQAHFIQGTTNRRALVIAGVHGNEVQGIEVAQRLLADLATTQPLFTVIVVPSLFPDNAARRSREGSTPTNRNFPPVTEDLAAATLAGGGTAVDARSRRGARTRAILPENIMLLELIERFSPERIISIHGTRHSGAGGVFFDQVPLSPADIARARSYAQGLAFMQVTVEDQQTPEGQARLQQAEQRNFLLELARMQNRDRDLAFAAATQIDADTTAITGREARPMEREGETTVPAAELTRRRAHPSVPGNVGPSGNFEVGAFSGGVPVGVSLGQYASQRGISIFTVEPPLNLRTGDYPTSRDDQVDAAERRIELEAYADAVRTVLLGR
jgi:hypothetical protein